MCRTVRVEPCLPDHLAIVIFNQYRRAQMIGEDEVAFSGSRIGVDTLILHEEDRRYREGVGITVDSDSSVFMDFRRQAIGVPVELASMLPEGLADPAAQRIAGRAPLSRGHFAAREPVTRIVVIARGSSGAAPGGKVVAVVVFELVAVGG